MLLMVPVALMLVGGPAPVRVALIGLVRTVVNVSLASKMASALVTTVMVAVPGATLAGTVTLPPRIAV